MHEPFFNAMVMWRHHARAGSSQRSPGLPDNSNVAEVIRPANKPSHMVRWRVPRYAQPRKWMPAVGGKCRKMPLVQPDSDAAKLRVSA
jgi:hypothetical protein